MSDDDISRSGFSAGRRWAVGFNALVGAMSLLAILAMVNYVADGHVKRFEWERHSPYQLSPQTVKVLAQLTNSVAITVFFDPQNEQDIYEMTTGLLREYQNANPRFIQITNMDYTRFPGQAKALRDRLHMDALKENDFVVIEANGRSKVFYARQLVDYDFSDVIAQKSKIVRRKAFKGEVYFTSAIFAVSNPRDIKSYFIYGHGEGDPGDPNDSSASPKKMEDLGYSKLAGILKTEANSDWQRLLLRGTNTIPADCQLLIIGGPHNAQFDTNEVAKVQAYLAQGGRLLLMLDRPSGLRPLMNLWGFDVADEPVIERDPQYRLYGDTQFLAKSLAVHPITDAINRENLGLLMVEPHPIYVAPKQPGAPEVVPLAWTSERAAVGKLAGTFRLICAVKLGVVKETRILVAGDPYFLDDQNIDRWVANHYFAQMALNWLLERPEVLLSDLGPSPIKEYKLATGSQISQLRWLFLAAMPGSVLFLGGLVWLRRRN